MRFSILTPTVFALSSAQTGLAQKAATFVSTTGTFSVVSGVCNNFSPHQPIYSLMSVRDTYDCTLFEQRNCVGKGTGFGEGDAEVEDLKFKSVACFSAAA